MIQLYDYQQDVINRTRKKMAERHKHIVIQSPTGSGKTVMFSYIAKQMQAKKNRVLILTDRIELLTETGGTLEEFGINAYKITAGQMSPPPKYYSCYIAMAQTLKNRINAKQYLKDWQSFFASFDLIIVDECHKQEFNPFFEDGLNVFNGAYVLGFTATPQRAGKQRQLVEDYSALVTGPTVTELIAKGKLVSDRYYGVESVSTEGVKIDRKTGDYDENQIFAKFNRPELYAGVVDQWLKHTPNTITICFCVNIQHVIETCREFNNRGIKAKFVTSAVSKPKLPDNQKEGQKTVYEAKKAAYDNYMAAYSEMSGERKDVIQQWKDRKFDILVNAGILTTGFNFKPIQTVIINRATLSDNLWLQMIGRGSRQFPGKKYFNILDFGGHGGHLGGRLGNYRDKRIYSLIHEQPTGGGAPPVKECGKQSRPGVQKDQSTGYTPDKKGRLGCGAYIAPSVMICPYCGYTYDSERELIMAELKLIDYDIIPDHGSLYKEPSKFEELEKVASNRGYKAGWITRQIALKYGVEGLEDYAKEKRHSQGWVWRMEKTCAAQIEEFERKQVVIEKTK